MNEVYRRYTDKSNRIWLVKEGKFAGDYIYAGQEVRKKIYRAAFPGQMGGGFGGAALEFELVNGMRIKLDGPYHMESEALYRNCGIDVRDKHRTYCEIGLDREFDGGNVSLKDVVYRDSLEVESLKERGEIIAKAYSRNLRRDVWLYNKFADRSEWKMVNYPRP